MQLYQLHVNGHSPRSDRFPQKMDATCSHQPPASNYRPLATIVKRVMYNIYIYIYNQSRTIIHKQASLSILHHDEFLLGCSFTFGKLFVPLPVRPCSHTSWWRLHTNSWPTVRDRQSMLRGLPVKKLKTSVEARRGLQEGCFKNRVFQKLKTTLLKLQKEVEGRPGLPSVEGNPAVANWFLPWFCAPQVASQTSSINISNVDPGCG